MAKTLTGIVVSDKTDKTIVVSVLTPKNHPLYRKAYTTSKRFMAHDEKNEAHHGDTVIITETRPLSARKRHILTKIVERAAISQADSVEAITATPKIEAETETKVEETSVTPITKKAVTKAPAKKAPAKSAKTTEEKA